MSAADK